MILIFSVAMQESSETLLTTIPGADDDERLELVLCISADGENRLELRQQSWGEGVGWYTQGTIELSPHQVADLRNALGTRTASARPFPAGFRQVSRANWTPRVVSAESA